MKTELQHCIRLFERRESFALAIVLSSRGSVPRRAGARMVVQQNGKTFGSIGGGSLEAKVTGLAKKIFITKIPIVKEFDLSVDKGKGSMLCGGSVKIMIDYISFENPNALKAWNRALQAIQNNFSANLITNISNKIDDAPGDVNCYFLNGEADEAAVTDTMHEKKEVSNVRVRQPQIIELGEKRFFIEPLTGLAKVYIFGSGQVAQQLAMLTVISGFKTIVLDDQRDYLIRRYFPLVEELILLEKYTEPFKDVKINADSYLIILTRDPMLDRQVLIEAIESSASYIGMIGSRKKCQAVRASLEQEGMDAGKFNRLHAPIGVSIGAETPEEVAISIAAELIQQRSDAREAAKKTSSNMKAG